MLAYIFPIAMVILSNIIYQVCLKSVPETMDPLACLTVTYSIGALTSLVLYFILHKEPNLLREYAQMNWAPIVMGFIIVGLEGGYLLAYKAGWAVSTASIVQSSFLAVALLLVGYFLFHEALTWNKLVGMLVCLVGLIIINKQP